MKFTCDMKEGDRYGRWTVIGPTVKHNKRWAIPCKCDCGTIKICDGYYLRSGQSKSCGCLNRELCVKRRELPQGLSGLRQLIWKYKFAAIDRKLTFELTEEQFSVLTKQECYYCGDPPSKIYRNNGGTEKSIKRSEYVYNGIDRKNNNIGYIIDNVVTCCWPCNRMKLALSDIDFLIVIKKIYNHRLKKSSK